MLCILSLSQCPSKSCHVLHRDFVPQFFTSHTVLSCLSVPPQYFINLLESGNLENFISICLEIWVIPVWTNKETNSTWVLWVLWVLMRWYYTDPLWRNWRYVETGQQHNVSILVWASTMSNWYSITHDYRPVCWLAVSELLVGTQTYRVNSDRPDHVRSTVAVSHHQWHLSVYVNISDSPASAAQSSPCWSQCYTTSCTNSSPSVSHTAIT